MTVKTPPTITAGTLPALFSFTNLSAYVGFGRSRVYQLIAEGKFPAPLKIGKSSRWVRAEIDTWVSEQMAMRMEGGAK